MAKTVDELLIKIKADTKELEKKLKNIKGELDTTGKTGIAAFGGAGLAGALGRSPKLQLVLLLLSVVLELQLALWQE